MRKLFLRSFSNHRLQFIYNDQKDDAAADAADAAAAAAAWEEEIIFANLSSTYHNRSCEDDLGNKGLIDDDILPLSSSPDDAPAELLPLRCLTRLRGEV